MDKFGNMFFGMLNPLALACWVSAHNSEPLQWPFWIDILFSFGEPQQPQDSRTDYNQQNIKIVAQSDEILQFVTGLKIITNGNGEEELWLLTNRFQVRANLISFNCAHSAHCWSECVNLFILQKVMTGTMSTAEPNFRIFAVRIRDLIGGTQCSGRNTNNFQFPRYWWRTWRTWGGVGDMTDWWRPRLTRGRQSNPGGIMKKLLAHQCVGGCRVIYWPGKVCALDWQCKWQVEWKGAPIVGRGNE